LCPEGLEVCYTGQCAVESNLNRLLIDDNAENKNKKELLQHVGNQMPK